VGLALATSFLWAGNAYSIRRGTVGLPVPLCNSLRYLMAALLLAVPWSIRQKRLRGAAERLLLSGAHLRRFVVTAFIEAFIGSTLGVYGLANSDLSVAAPLTSLAPLFAVPMGLFLGSEKLHLRRLLAIVLTVAGLVILLR
jgi:drug/metabolite transporter (DMT)-like permease